MCLAATATAAAVDDDTSRETRMPLTGVGNEKLKPQLAIAAQSSERGSEKDITLPMTGHAMRRLMLTIVVVVVGVFLTSVVAGKSRGGGGGGGFHCSN